MSVRSIYGLLRAAGMTREGACALMGNMMAESALRSDNAQDSRGVDDGAYTAAVDNGLLDFVGDGIGYGLCQWTLSSRKQKLLAFARARGASIGDEEMQARFCIRELREDFPGLWTLLTGSHDLSACTREVMTDYENPAVKNLSVRLEYARQAMAFFLDGAAEPPERDGDAPDAAVAVMQMVMRCGGFWEEKPTGRKSPAFFQSLRAFIDELEGG